MTDELRLPEVMNIRQLAETLGVSTKTVMRAIDAGELRASKLAARGCWVVQRDDVFAWLDARATPRGRPIEPSHVPARATVRGRRRPGGPLKLTDDMGRAA